MRHDTPSWLRAASHAGVVWLGLSALTLALGAALDGMTLGNALLPTPERLSLVARELALLAVPAFAAGGALAWVAYEFAAGGRRAGSWIAGAVAAVVLLLYLSSWITFHSNGRFLDWAALEFLDSNPVQFFQHAAHIEPWMLVVAPVLLIVAGLLVIWAPARALRGAGRRIHGIVAGVSVVAVALCAALGSRGLSEDFPSDVFVTDPDAGMVYTYLDLYAECRDERAGPMTHAWADVRQAWFRTEPPLVPDPSIEVVRRPIISLDDYAGRVDPERIHRWNVIVVLVESLRTDQLVVTGGSRVVMPGVEALAAEGVAFPDHYSQASHSNYADLCPLSSHYPLRSPRVHLYPKNPTYPRVLIYDVLKRMGWHTAIVSSQNEVWGQMINYLQTGNVDHFFHSESFEGPTYVPRNDTGFEEFLKGSKRSGKIDDRFTIDEAMRWIQSVDDGAPFFIYLNLQNSHLPYETPADFPRRFGPDRLPFAITFGGFPRSQVQTVKDIYADSLAYSDFQLTRLVDFLRASGQWDRTLVVVTGDTGQAFYEHGFTAHANRIFEELVRVPLVIRAPGMTPLVDPRPAQQIDVPPTVLDLLGLPPHPSFQGVSLVAPGPDPDRSRYLMVQAPLAHQYGVVRDQFKLVYDVDRDRTTLVNLRRDPMERRDVSARHPDLAHQLRRRVDTWRALQLEYYRDPAEHTRTYPPVLRD